MQTWVPTLGPVRAEAEWKVKKERELNPIRPPAVYVMPSYQSPVTGKWIDSPGQRRDDLARTGSRPWEGMEQEKKEAARRETELDQSMDRLAEKIAVDSWQRLPEEHRQALS